MARIIEEGTVANCQDCPYRQDGHVVEDICGETDQHIYDDYDENGPRFPDMCPLKEADNV